MQTFCWTQTAATPIATAVAARNGCPDVQVPYGDSAPSSCSAVCPVSYAVFTTPTTSSKIAYYCTPSTTKTTIPPPPSSPPPSPPPSIPPPPSLQPPPAPPAPTPPPVSSHLSTFVQNGRKTTVVVMGDASRPRLCMTLYVLLLLSLCICVSRYSALMRLRQAGSQSRSVSIAGDRRSESRWLVTST